MTLDELQAGPGLDKIVAIKVFGHDADLVDRYPASYTLPYSTDIRAAFGVVEKLQATNFDFSLEYTRGNGGEPWGWTANFCPRPLDWDAGFVVQQISTAPLAICKAALCAVDKNYFQSLK